MIAPEREELVGVTRIADVVVLRINRSHRRNAMTSSVRADLTRALAGAGDDPDVSGVVVASSDAAFSAGQDLSESKEFAPLDVAPWIDEHMDLYRAALECPKPVIAAIDGCCVGAGMQLALMADLRIGTPGAFFAMPELDDAIPCILGTWALYDIIGRARTAEMVLTNRQVDADEALRWGLLNRVVSADAVLAEALALVGRLARKPFTAFSLTKRRLAAILLQGDRELATHAKFAHMAAFSTGEPMRAMEAFLNHGRES